MAPSLQRDNPCPSTLIATPSFTTEAQYIPAEMSYATHPNVAISAPGKVLLAGGYLVLDRKYTGLVLGLSARINVIAGQIHSSEGVQLNEIIVESPQFLEAQWRYGYRLSPDDGGMRVTQLQVYVA